MEGRMNQLRTLAWRHRARLLRGLTLLLIAVIVLQNVEPTTIDVLFWSIARVPKLILIVASMGLGVLLWEIGKQTWRSRSRKPDA
jgi:uncharacterized integral membrane protein